MWTWFGPGHRVGSWTPLLWPWWAQALQGLSSTTSSELGIELFNPLGRYGHWTPCTLGKKSKPKKTLNYTCTSRKVWVWSSVPCNYSNSASEYLTWGLRCLSLLTHVVSDLIQSVVHDGLLVISQVASAFTWKVCSYRRAFEKASEHYFSRKASVRCLSRENRTEKSFHAGVVFSAVMLLARIQVVIFSKTVS